LGIILVYLEGFGEVPLFLKFLGLEEKSISIHPALGKGEEEKTGKSFTPSARLSGHSRLYFAFPHFWAPLSCCQIIGEARG